MGFSAISLIKIARLAKRVASALLVLCFVLPLSMCTAKYPDANGRLVSTETRTYGFELTKQAWSDVRQGNTLDGMALLLAIFNVFFFR
jgi:hypothetical protein